MSISSISTLKKINSFKNMPALIAESLKEQIICNNIKGGTQLKQDEIAKQFDVSLIPVREAIIILESQGLVSCIRNKGAIVTHLTNDEMNEVFNLRNILEIGAAAQAIPNLEDEHIEKAKYLCEKMDKANDSYKWSRLNWLFHEVLYMPTKNNKLMNVIEDLFIDIQRYTVLQLEINDDTTKANKEHKQIIEAYISKDIEKAVYLIEEHINSGREKLASYFSNKESKI